MLCPSCDADVQTGQLFCYQCGRQLQPQTTTTATAPEPTKRIDHEWTPPMQTHYTPSSAGSLPSVMNPPSSSVQVVLPGSINATLSLVFGVLAWFVLPIVGALVAVVLGHIARTEIRDSHGTLGGKGQAIAGLVLGYTQLVLVALAICAILVMMGFVFGVAVS